MQQQLWFWWDGDDRLRKATASSNSGATAFFQASYDGDGLRKSKDDTRSGFLIHHDFSWSPYGLLYDSNASTVYTPGFGQRANGTDSFYQVDWLGSTRYTTNSTGRKVASQSYDAFGKLDGQGPGSPNHPTDLQWAGGWGYQSEWRNGTIEPGLGLDYLQQRYYDPLVGPFISPDPLSVAAGPNLFAYVGNDPTASADPLGLLTLPNNPSGLGPDWYRDPGHGRDGQGSDRWLHEEGKIGLDFDRGRPGAGGDQEQDHWHVLFPDPKRPGKWIRGKGHLPPGAKIPDMSFKRYQPCPKPDPEPGLVEDWDFYWLLIAPWLRLPPLIAPEFRVPPVLKNPIPLF